MKQKNRVVVTGMGVISSNAHGLNEFEEALIHGQNGIRFIEALEKAKFAAHVGGVPQNIEEKLPTYFKQEDLLAMNEAMIYAGIASLDAYHNAGLEVPKNDGDVEADRDTGAIIGLAMSGLDTISDKLVPTFQKASIRRLGSTIIEQIMCSSVSAKVGGLLGLGNQVSTNSSACATGTEAIIMAYERIKAGLAQKMLAGGTEGTSPYLWAGFDAMRLLCRNFNQEPQKASRPMSTSAGGFVAAGGSGILFLESLESAKKRKARIYAEVLGGSINCGGQRMGGSMTAPNSKAFQQNIKTCLQSANIHDGTQIDYINGHLTGSFADSLEIENWATALELVPEKLPYINATKSLIGHALGAAGSIECIATIIQLHKNFIHGSLNCEDLHDKIKVNYEKSVVQKTKKVDLQIAAKASLGFGDVNSCVLFKAWDNEDNGSTRDSQ